MLILYNFSLTCLTFIVSFCFFIITSFMLFFIINLSFYKFSQSIFQFCISIYYGIWYQSSRVLTTQFCFICFFDPFVRYVGLPIVDLLTVHDACTSPIGIWCEFLFCFYLFVRMDLCIPLLVCQIKGFASYRFSCQFSVHQFVTLYFLMIRFICQQRTMWLTSYTSCGL